MTKQKWTIDPFHSAVEFSVSHLMISKIKGIFEEYDAHMMIDPDNFTDADISFSINAGSMNTRHAERDKHLKSDLFLHTEEYPFMTFQGENIQRNQDGSYNLTGKMTIRGVIKPVTFLTTFGGSVIDHRGTCRLGYMAQTTIDRKEFGITYNIALDAGGVVIGDEVAITILLELMKAD